VNIAVVILNWNGRTHLETYLPSVVKFSSIEGCEIIVADNGSTDDSMSFMSDNYPEIRIIQLDRNYGFAGGYNKALEQVDAEIFCLLNSDVRVTEGWIDPVLKLFAQDKNIAAIQPKILSDRDCSRFEHAGAAGGFIDKFGYPFCRGRIMDTLEYDNGQYDESTGIFWASGACLFIRSTVFMQNGGFDADYFAHMEEIDLCWRLKNQGFTIVYCNESKIYHFGGATLEYNNPRKLFLNFRNSLWTLYKNYTGSYLGCMMFKRMSIDTIAILKYLLVFDLKNAAAIIKAHFAYYRSKSELKLKRNDLQKLVSKREHSEMLGKSIVWQYFIKSKHAFVDYNDFRKNIS